MLDVLAVEQTVSRAVLCKLESHESDVEQLDPPRGEMTSSTDRRRLARDVQPPTPLSVLVNRRLVVVRT